MTNNNKFKVSLVIVLVSILLYRYLQQYNKEHDDFSVNWDRNVVVKANYKHQPRHKQQLIQLMNEIRESNGHLKVVGAHHSWSGITQLPITTFTTTTTRMTHLVNLDYMNQVLSIHLFDEKERTERKLGKEFVGTVTVEAGIRLKNLIKYLNERGYTLKMLGSVTEQSIAGAISTGTHGSSRHVSVMANMVVSMEMLLANGTLITIDSNNELLQAVRVNLGCLGIITKVEVLFVNAFHLHLLEQPVDVTQLHTMSELIDQSEYAKIWWFPHTNFTQLYTMNTIEVDSKYTTTLLYRTQDWIENTLVNTHLLDLFVRLVSLLPSSIIPHTNQLVQSIAWKKRERVDYSHRLLPLKHDIPIHREMEFSVPFDFWIDALLTLGKLEQELYFDFVHEFRFVKSDNVWMSPGYGRDSVFITITLYGQPADHVFRRCQEVLLGLMDELKQKHGHKYSAEQQQLIFALRPHWGKTHYLKSKELRSVLPKFDQFIKLREEWDPTNIFMNELLQSFFYE
jgi:FAD/FMN-containing dehydrogenase